jgi:hypothetical protein
VVIRRRVFSFSILAVLASASVFCGAYQHPSTTQAPAASQAAPQLQQIVTAVEQRQADNHAAARPYSMVREYRLFGSESAAQPESVVVARIQYLAPDHTEYAILNSSGSSRGVGIVRRILENETELHKDPQNYGLISSNYNFTYDGQQTIDGHRCYVLRLDPKRRDHRLIEGRAFVDADSFQVRLIQGEEAKSPSWWLKKVQLTMHYGDIGEGVWAPISTQAVADVRWFGKRLFTSRELSGSVGATVAETQRLRPSLPQGAQFAPSSKTPARTVGKRGVSRPTGSIPAVVGIDIPQF